MYGSFSERKPETMGFPHLCLPQGTFNLNQHTICSHWAPHFRFVLENSFMIERKTC